MTGQRPLCIYHGGCPDGFTAAWIVNGAYDGGVDLHPAQYGQDPPDVKGRSVVVVDFSYKRPVMERIVGAAARLLVLDHHQTAAEDLDGLADGTGGRVRVEFDMTRSGAMLAWDYSHPGEQPLDLVCYVQDRDLWTRALPDNDAVHGAITSRPFTLEAWDALAATPLVTLKAEGRAVAMYRERLIERAVAESFMFVLGRWRVPVANCIYSIGSEVAGQLAVGHPFAGYYFDLPDGVQQWGLRSTDDGEDVARIAEQLGGGGHKHAAGFKIRPWRARGPIPTDATPQIVAPDPTLKGTW